MAGRVNCAHMTEALNRDIAAVVAIDVVPKILEVICRTTGLGFAAVARVTEDRWIACVVRDEIAFGLVAGGELEIKSTLCDTVRSGKTSVVIDQASQDSVYRDHPTPKQYGFESYISTPIFYRGEFFGTLCAIDPNPAKLRDTPILATFELFADLIASHLDAQQRLETTEAALLDERETAELRDQFIAVLGHDLRNPLAAIEGGARLLIKEPPADRAKMILTQMMSATERMAALISDVMDFARGRLGGGFSVERALAAPMRLALEDVIAEFRAAQPDRVIETQFDLTQPVAADSQRVAQLFSNLVANALTHGDNNAPVTVSARTIDGRFDLSVANQGPIIRAEMLPKLFQPFSRASGRPNQGGLGLGLYIASEIAKAHGGDLTASSNPIETRFTFSMPLGG